jgi:hypothetical protein
LIIKSEVKQIIEYYLPRDNDIDMFYSCRRTLSCLMGPDAYVVSNLGSPRLSHGGSSLGGSAKEKAKSMFVRIRRLACALDYFP